MRALNYDLISSKQQADAVRDEPVNTAQHLAAKEPEMFLWRGWTRPECEQCVFVPKVKEAHARQLIEKKQTE